MFLYVRSLEEQNPDIWAGLAATPVVSLSDAQASEFAAGSIPDTIPEDHEQQGPSALLEKPVDAPTRDVLSMVEESEMISNPKAVETVETVTSPGATEPSAGDRDVRNVADRLAPPSDGWVEVPAVLSPEKVP